MPSTRLRPAIGAALEGRPFLTRRAMQVMREVVDAKWLSRISMKMVWATFRAVLASVGCGMLAVPSYALHLNGVWPIHGSLCNEVFVKKETKSPLVRIRGEYGGGFVVKGNRTPCVTTFAARSTSMRWRI